MIDVAENAASETPEDRAGLTQEEAQLRLQEFGPNLLSAEKSRGPLGIVLGVFREPMFFLLLLGATVYFILGSRIEAGVLLFFVLVVMALTLFQELRAERSLEALKELSAPKARVLRDGEVQLIQGANVVPGDLVLLEEGDQVPADGAVLESLELFVDESLLTGESVPVSKLTCGIVDLPPDEHFRPDHVYSGSTVVLGRGLVLVTSTGDDTVYGGIGKALAGMKTPPTPLQRKTSRLVRWLAVVGLFLAIIVIVVTFVRGETLLASLLAGIALAMAILPEEFPVVLTVFMSLGARRLARNDALIRRIPAVETLGSATVLCVDKTGTLTENRMSVRGLYIHGHLHVAEEDLDDPDDRMLLEAGVLASEKEPYDPMERAFLTLAAQRDVEPTALYATHELVHEYAFDVQEKMMAHIWQSDHGTQLVAKGSPESLLPLCDLPDAERIAALESAEIMADRGLRVLAFGEADGVAPPYRERFQEYPLRFLGLIGLKDPARAGIEESIARAQAAGVRIIMITGDHPATARAIGHEIGLDNHEHVLTGKELDGLSTEELAEEASRTSIFARVIPEHKLRIVEALQSRGEIVGMTGDGVNDAPALKRADIGIAMGMRGTEVARQAADMVLLDDDFTTITYSIEDGRRIYDNIKKAMAYILIIHIPIALTALLVPIVGLPLLLLPAYIVLLELLIDPTCSIVFEGQAAEPDIMRRPPRDPAEPLVDRSILLQTLSQGLAVLAVVLGVYYYLAHGLALDADVLNAEVQLARTFSLAVLVFADIALVIENLSLRDSLFASLRDRSNRARYFVNGLALAALLLVIYLPALHRLFYTVPLSAAGLAAAAGIGFGSVLWWEIVKWERRRRALKPSSRQRSAPAS